MFFRTLNTFIFKRLWAYAHITLNSGADMKKKFSPLSELIQTDQSEGECAAEFSLLQSWQKLGFCSQIKTDPVIQPQTCIRLKVLYSPSEGCRKQIRPKRYRAPLAWKVSLFTTPSHSCQVCSCTCPTVCVGLKSKVLRCRFASCMSSS